MTLFGTDGIRDKAGKGRLHPDSVHRLGVSLGRLLRENAPVFSVTGAPLDRGAILIGRDTRASGEAIEGQLTSGIIGFGNEVWAVGVLPTPGVAYLTRSWSCSLGIVISASHNPAEDNGIKLISPEGLKIPDAAERLIEQLYDAPTVEEPPDPLTTVYRRVNNRIDEYLGFLRDQLGGALRGLRIVLDCANGATATLAPRLFQMLGAVVVPINTSPDGTNINRDAGVLQPGLIADRVVQEKAALGAAFDGDGDRCILIDEKGNVCDGDYILAALSASLPAGAVVVSTVMANYALETWLTGNGLGFKRTPVGDRWVADEMRRTGAVLGGEQSGHIICMDASPTGDGLLTTIRILREMRMRGKPLSQLCPGFQKVPQVLLNVPVSSKPPLESVPDIQKAIREAEEGLQGRVLVRYSGTEALCRVMVEGVDASQVRHIADTLGQVVRNALR